MTKPKNAKPVRLIKLGNFEWAHWLTIAVFVISGLLIAIFPSVLLKRAIAPTIAVGVIIFAFGLFCLVDQIIYLCRLKKWKQAKSGEKQNTMQ